ncbi:MAG: hypothetical protein ACOH5I_22330 [Oligoflexus sp.]
MQRLSLQMIVILISLALGRTHAQSSLTSIDNGDLTKAMSSVSNYLTMTSLAGKKIPVVISLDRSKLHAGDTSPLILKVRRVGEFGHPFSISLHSTSEDFASGLEVAPENWQHLIFRPQENEKHVYFYINKADPIKKVFPVAIDLTAPHYVELSHKQLGFLVENLPDAINAHHLQKSLSTQELEQATVQYLTAISQYAKPEITLKSTNHPTEGKDTHIEIDIILSYSLAHEIWINLSFDGKALLDQDFQAFNTIRIPAFSTKESIKLPLIDDDIVENREKLVVYVLEHEELATLNSSVELWIDDDDGLGIKKGHILWFAAESNGLRNYTNSHLDLQVPARLREPKLDISRFFANSFHFSQNEAWQADASFAQSFAIAIRTDDQISQKQMVLEQKSHTGRVQIYIENQEIHLKVSTPQQNLSHSSQKIHTFTNYYIIAVIDFQKKTLLLSVNENETTSSMEDTKHIEASTQLILGASHRGETRYEYFYKGEMAELILFQHSLDEKQRQHIYEYWGRKY